MYRKFLFLPLLIICSFAFAFQVPQPTMVQYTKMAEQCPDLNCVRVQIDAVDSQMVALLGKRLALVKRAGEIKNPHEFVHDRNRETEIINKIEQQVRAIGYSPSIARQVFMTILLQSNLYEESIHKSYWKMS